jgi:uncharacterized protein YpuA (DUF1002 family)
MATEEELFQEQQKEILQLLEERFEQHMHRHENIKWEDVQAKLEADQAKLVSLYEMEATGGEPDVVGYDEKKKQYIFADCSKESPKGRRSVCYDREALESRKKHPPKTSVMDMVEEMGIELLTEEQYRKLQSLEVLDQKTSSWVKTPDSIREKGGAIFCDYRYGHVFVYHNGADSYYSSRGFRGLLYV